MASGGGGASGAVQGWTVKVGQAGMATYKQSGEVQALLSARLSVRRSPCPVRDPYLEDFQHLLRHRVQRVLSSCSGAGVKNV